jgi:WD40 repeat protein
VQTALAHAPMRRLETDRFIIYYPAPKRAEIDRFVAHASRCTDALRTHATWSEKMVIVMPDVAFNNAFVLPDLAGYEAVSVIPLQATLDFATEFGIPPDPGYIACHELTHYVHQWQVAGWWSSLDSAFGHLYTPQIGYDAWFWEGLATHYESELQPGAGRPHWPIFTGMYAAGYAGKHVGGGDMSTFARQSSVGHHYLVGTMFFRFLTERYGDRPVWATIADNAHALTGWFFPGTFKTGFGVSFGDLMTEFDTWTHAMFPVRTAPPGERELGHLGNDARYARGRDGTEAWVGEDLDRPPRLVVRDPSGHVLEDTNLIEVMPPRKLVEAAPLLVSGFSITADGREVWLTVIDLGATFQIPRTFRWTRASGLQQMADDLGPGAAISPAGDRYFYCFVDGDAWGLAVYDLGTHRRQFLIDPQPGVYVLTAQPSPDGKRLAASVWDGHAFVIWVLDATTGDVLRTIGGNPFSPVYDPSFTSDGRVLYLGTVEGRFQAFIESTQLTDAPYSVLNAREASGSVRFMSRLAWDWNLSEVKTAPYDSSLSPSTTVRHPAIEKWEREVLDEPYSGFDHLFYPQERAPTLLFPSSGGAMLGGVVAGGDRLGMQRWSLAGYVQPASNRTHWGGAAAYLNTMLAPVLILAEASTIDWLDTDPDTKATTERKTRDATVGIGYTYRNTLLTTFGGTYTSDYDPNRRALGGPQLTTTWYSNETTRYTGDRRAFIASAGAAFYPQQASTFASDITDVGGSLGGVVPLPFGRRHTLHATVRGRALLSSENTGLLQVGGDSGLAELWNRSSVSTPAPTFDDTRFPSNLRFIEPLRGYEDYEITTDRAVLADVGWTYPIIIDEGVASSLRYGPASYLRQLDLELFGAGAIDRAANHHVAAGGALTLRFQLFRIPFAVTYQIARRLVDDRALTQLVAVAPGQ